MGCFLRSITGTFSPSLLRSSQIFSVRILSSTLSIYQISTNGVQEDRLNKPDHPISSGLTTKSATGFRHIHLLCICLFGQRPGVCPRSGSSQFSIRKDVNISKISELRLWREKSLPSGRL